MSYDEFFNKVNVLSSNKMYKFIDENLIECNDLISEINRVLLENGSVQILKNIRDIKLQEMLYLFQNIKLKDIPTIELPPTKERELNPLVRGRRLK